MYRWLTHPASATLLAVVLWGATARAETPADMCATSPPVTETSAMSRESLNMFGQCYHARPRPDLVAGWLEAMDRDLREQEGRAGAAPPVG